MLSWGVAWNASAENIHSKLRIDAWKAERETSHRENYGIFSYVISISGLLVSFAYFGLDVYLRRDLPFYLGKGN